MILNLKYLMKKKSLEILVQYTRTTTTTTTTKNHKQLIALCLNLYESSYCAKIE
jgi:hypothetical protein